MPHRNPSQSSGCLYIVATPIGNMKDITYRAVEILRDADLILCESPQNSYKLLSYYGIKNQILAYNDHSNQADRDKVLNLLLSGKQIALISDAGTPLISDPGFKLVRDCRQAHIPVVPIPGASAVTAALSVCGLPTDRFLFCGFLPKQHTKMLAALEELKSYSCTLLFYESPKRLYQAVQAISKIMGDRQLVFARELTKLHEEVISTTCQDFLHQYTESHRFKGEIVLVVQGNPNTTPDYDLNSILVSLLKEHTVKETVAIAQQMTNLPKKEVYTAALSLAKKA